jgi:hypothetical protein
VTSSGQVLEDGGASRLRTSRRMEELSLSPSEVENEDFTMGFIYTVI